MGAYINTNHYKSSWASQWTSVGVKKFHDGLEVPYYETEGNFPFLDVQNYTAVSIPLKVFHINETQFFMNSNFSFLHSIQSRDNSHVLLHKSLL